jgi:hypothetical protein
MPTDLYDEYVTVDTDLLKSRIALVSLDNHSMSAGRRSLREMQKMMMQAVVNGCENVSVPCVWFRELEAAYILLF